MGRPTTVVIAKPRKQLLEVRMADGVVDAVELIGQSEDQRHQRELVVRLCREDVETDALSLGRLVE